MSRLHDKLDEVVSTIIKEDEFRGSIVNTGLSASDNKAYEILSSVIGQLSDGIWENSPSVERYWRNLDIDKRGGNIVILAHGGYDSPFYDWRNRSMVPDEKIKAYMATKIKQIVKKEGLEWSRENTQPSAYMAYDDSITVRDCYRVYDKLLGRKDRITEATDNAEWKDICRKFCSKIGAELLFVNDDNFGYESKDGELIHMYADELVEYLKTHDLKEDIDSNNLRCYACDKPTTVRDELGRPICDECYGYVSALVEFGEWAKDKDGVDPTIDDFRSYRGNWGDYFEDKEFDDIPFDYLEKEALNIYYKIQLDEKEHQKSNAMNYKLKESEENGLIATIYQIPGRDDADYIFMPYDYAKDKFDFNDYLKVATISIPPIKDINETLEYIFMVGNTRKDTFTEIQPMRSISVSDVIKINDDIYYVDTFGFQKVGNLNEGYSLGDDKESFGVWDEQEKKLEEICKWLEEYSNVDFSNIEVEHSQDSIYTADFTIKNIPEDSIDKDFEFELYNKYEDYGSPINNIQLEKWNGPICIIGFDIDNVYGQKSSFGRTVNNIIEEVKNRKKDNNMNENLKENDEQTPDIKQLADDVYFNIESKYKGSEINPESVYLEVIRQVDEPDDDSDLRYQVYSEIMSDWEWYDQQEKKDWEKYMEEHYDVYLADMINESEEVFKSCEKKDSSDINESFKLQDPRDRRKYVIVPDKLDDFLKSSEWQNIIKIIKKHGGEKEYPLPSVDNNSYYPYYYFNFGRTDDLDERIIATLKDLNIPLEDARVDGFYYYDGKNKGVNDFETVIHINGIPLEIQTGLLGIFITFLCKLRELGPDEWNPDKEKYQVRNGAGDIEKKEVAYEIAKRNYANNNTPKNYKKMLDAKNALIAANDKIHTNS